MQQFDVVLTLLRTNPRWSVFTNAAAVSLGFLIGFVPALTEELVSQEQVSLQGEQAARESTALGAVYDLTHAALQAHQTAAKRYQQELAGREAQATLPDKTIRQRIVEASAARSSIAIAVGAMQGITVTDDVVSRTVEKLSVATNKLDRNVLALQSMYVAMLAKDQLATAKSRDELRVALAGSDAAAAELLTAFASFDTAAKTWMKSRSIIIGEATGRAKLFGVRIAVALLAFVVLVGFIAAALTTLLRTPNEPSRIVIAR
jgi:hypothetical protein